jgi:hypothetical protein
MGVNRSAADSLHWLAAWPRRIPLTLALMTVIIVVALLTGALTTGTAAATVARWGFSLDNLRRGRILTMFTGDMMVYNRRHLLSVLGLLVVFVAPVEWLAGSGFTAAVYWPGSITGSLIASIITALLESITSWAPTANMVSAADVGASVATWSAAGALTVLLGFVDARLVWPVRIVLGAFLLARIVLYTGTGDLAHAFGYCIGMTIAHLWMTSHQPVRTIAGKAA